MEQRTPVGRKSTCFWTLEPTKTTSENSTFFSPYLSEYQGAVKKSGGQDMPISRTATNLLTYLCSRLEWFRFNESAHAMVKQKTLATDLSRRLGLEKSSFRSNPSSFFFLELWLKSTYLHACLFATFCIDSPLSLPKKADTMRAQTTRGGVQVRQTYNIRPSRVIGTVRFIRGLGRVKVS